MYIKRILWIWENDLVYSNWLWLSIKLFPMIKYVFIQVQTSQFEDILFKWYKISYNISTFEIFVVSIIVCTLLKLYTAFYLVFFNVLNALQLSILICFFLTFLVWVSLISLLQTKVEFGAQPWYLWWVLFIYECL